MDRHRQWQQRIAQLTAQGRYRQPRTLTPTGPTTARLNGVEVLVACSNDYLGLSWHPDVRGAATGGGVGSSRLISGDRPVHRELEAELEDWLGRPATLFTSGYHANMGVLPSVCIEGMRVASDALNHASTIDGLRLSRAQRSIVPHARPDAIPSDADAVIIEGLYSMDGDIPPIADYPAGPLLVVDEAHALGCLGPQGRGAAAAQDRVPDIRIGTFGKALGAHGAFVEGPPSLKELLVNTARTYIFTTGIPEPTAAMALAGLRRMRREPGLAEQLASNAAYFRRALTQLGWAPLGQAHIVPIVVGDRAVALDQQLSAKGVFAAAIRAPTVAPGSERIRFTVSAAHTQTQLNQICDALGPR